MIYTLLGLASSYNFQDNQNMLCFTKIKGREDEEATRRVFSLVAHDNKVDREPNVCILQKNVTLESERYTAEFLYIECLNIA